MTCAGRIGFVAAVVALAAPAPALAQARTTQVLAVAQDRVLDLDLAVPSGEVEIFQGRDDRITITIDARAGSGESGDEAALRKVLAVERDGNRIRLRPVRDALPEARTAKVSYRIDVPHWSRVEAFVGAGRLTLIGVMGPVRAVTEHGAIRVSYVSTDLTAEARAGNLDLRVVGGTVRATTGKGDIRGERLAQGGRIETGDGDIVLSVVGAVQARVRRGAGRLDISGARGPVDAATDRGALHVKAVPHDDWALTSTSGTIQVELPPAASFDLDAATEHGVIDVERSDLGAPAAPARKLHRTAAGGGPRIALRDGEGTIVVQ